MKNESSPLTLANLANQLNEVAKARKLADPTPEPAPPTPPPRPSKVTCSTCQHGIPASSDPWSWHSCGQGVDRATGWGMTPRKCEQWETRP